MAPSSEYDNRRGKFDVNMDLNVEKIWHIVSNKDSHLCPTKIRPNTTFCWYCGLVTTHCNVRMFL